MSRMHGLAELRAVVTRSAGPSQVVAIVNGGDGPTVEDELSRLRPELFRADGAVTILAHEEPQRRGQLLGLVDAMRHWRHLHGPFDPDRVAVGIMLPGKGTRLSPITQRLYGIKPFFPVPVRHRRDGPWFTAAAASLYTWTPVAHHLERMGFRGVAWKWGDEPIVPSADLAAMRLDLSGADAVRFGVRAEVTEEAARNKEWLRADPDTGDLLLQVRRRPLAELRERLDLDRGGQALLHAGSPAFSHAFLEAVEETFGDVEGWLDVDGYLFEALTHDDETWRREVERDAGLRALLDEHPDFRERVARLRQAVERRTGRPLAVKVVDLGGEPYWGDVGRLDPARRVWAVLAEDGEEAGFARALACLEDVAPDRHGNLLVGRARVPGDGSVRRCVVIDSFLGDGSRAEGAVVAESEIGRAELEPGAVVLRATAVRLRVGRGGFAFASIGENLEVPEGTVHTSIPADPADLAKGLEDWRAELSADTGSAELYDRPAFGNPASFAEVFARMRSRSTSPDGVERAVTELARTPVRKAGCLPDRT